MMNYKEEQNKVRTINWIEIIGKTTSGVKRTFDGKDVTEAFQDIEDSNYFNKDRFWAEEDFWKFEDDGATLIATDAQLIEFLEDENLVDAIKINDADTDVMFNINDCNVNWENMTFTISNFTDEIEDDLLNA